MDFLKDLITYVRTLTFETVSTHSKTKNHNEYYTRFLSYQTRKLKTKNQICTSTISKYWIKRFTLVNHNIYFIVYILYLYHIDLTNKLFQNTESCKTILGLGFC